MCRPKYIIEYTNRECSHGRLALSRTPSLRRGIRSGVEDTISCPELVEGMAEIEFSVLSRSCLKQRLSGEEALLREVDALVKERNAARASINWRFNTRDARTKLHRLYPSDFTVD